MEYKIVRLIDQPEMKVQMAQWFHEKWGVPLDAYLESMDDCLTTKKPVPQWYVAIYERYGWEFLCMVQGDGEPDLTRMYIHKG